MNRTRAWMQLVRLPNLFTAPADVLAGFWLIGGGADISDLAIINIASVCFYAGGVVLNDVFDAARDAANRSERPIPSGWIGRGQAAMVGAALLGSAVVLCSVVSDRALYVGLALAACILLYDGPLKRSVFAPPLMGACRALNLLLGACLAGQTFERVSVFAACVLGIYVTSLTLFARAEAGRSEARDLRMAAGGVCVAVFSLIGIQAFLPQANSWYLLMVGALLGKLIVPMRRAIESRQPGDVQTAVVTLVLGVVVVDASIAFAAHGPLAACSIIVLLLPSVALSRAFRVT